jgi:hypothetical protein
MSNYQIKRIIILVLCSLAIMGCKERYRYDCQDPANWKEAECKKPHCIAMGYCTEWLIDTGEDHVEKD